MKRNPVFCIKCGVHFHLPYETNDLALRLAFPDEFYGLMKRILYVI